jgi:hypothetical protein
VSDKYIREGRKRGVIEKERGGYREREGEIRG